MLASLLRATLPLAGLLGLVGMPTVASAEASKAADTVQLAGGVGYGLSLEDGINPSGWGFGARAGTNVDLGNGYLGVFFDFHLGDSQESGASEASLQGHFLGLAVGYDVDVSPGLAIRPLLGLGSHLVVRELCVGDECESETTPRFFFAPGAQLVYVNEMYFIAPEWRLNVTLAEKTVKTMSIMFHVGALL